MPPHLCPLALLALTRRAQRQIECFFKRVKAAGYQLEAWQQEYPQGINPSWLSPNACSSPVWLVSRSGKSPPIYALRVQQPGNRRIADIPHQTQWQANAA